MHTFQKMIVPGVVTLAITGMLAGCGASAASSTGQAGVPVKVIKLSPSADAGLSGKIIPDQDIKIVSKGSGKVAAVNVQEGDKVKKGDVLVQLETDDLTQQVRQAESSVNAAQAKLSDTMSGARAQEIQGLESALQAAQGAYEQASASVAQAKSGFELAESSYNRLRNQFNSSSIITQSDLDKGSFEYEKAKAAFDQAQAAQKAAEAQAAAAKAKLELTKAGATSNTVAALQADVERLNAGLELARNSLNNAAITAPIDGVIVKKSISPGEMAQAGATILSLVDMSQVQVELSVAENQISQVQAGAAVEVKVSNVPGKTFQGTIVFVSPVSNANSSTFPVKVRVDNKDGLLFAGMIADVNLNASQQARVEVPKSAIMKKDGKEYLFTVENNAAAHLVEVKTEEKNQDWVYVQLNDQMKAGATLVVNPSDQLAEGTKVKVE